MFEAFVLVLVQGLAVIMIAAMATVFVGAAISVWREVIK